MNRAITAKRLRELLSYDPATGIFIWRTKRAGRCRQGSRAGCLHDGYINIRVSGRTYKAHRLAWLYVHGRWPRGRLDHENTMGADNRMSNLRLATHSQNIANSRRRRDNASGFKGVAFCTAANPQRWLAYINKNGKRTYLGLHDTPELASAAYEAAAKRLFKKFARAA